MEEKEEKEEKKDEAFRNRASVGSRKLTAHTPRSPVVPGHEIIGHVAAVADGETVWKVGDRIGGAWHGSHDGKVAHRACVCRYRAVPDFVHVRGW